MNCVTSIVLLHYKFIFSPKKFTTMKTQEFKNVNTNYDENFDEKKPEPEQDSSEDEAADATRKFRHKHKLDKSTCYFLPLNIIEKFFGIPNLQGIHIYQGINKNDKEVLVLVGSTEIDGKYHDVISYRFTINHNEKLTVGYQNAYVTSLPPCPPPNPCPPPSKMNSDI